MKVKLDENLGRTVAERFREAGHDTATVRDQELSGTSDETLFRVCADEERVLVTLDLDFADPLRFEPTASAGVAVMRVPGRPGQTDLLAVVARLLDALSAGEITGHLWVVDHRRVRQYEPPDA